jgi:hypothetical protein
MDVGNVVLRIARGTRLRKRRAFAHVVAATHEERSQMRQRGPVAAGGDDRDRRPMRRHLTRERDLSGRRSSHDVRAVERDVDAAVLSTRIRVVADGETAEHRAVRRPVPGERVRDRQQLPGCCGNGDHGHSRCPSR